MGRARHEYGRGRPTRTPRQTMLILCEGETEARYLTEACAGARLVSVLVRRAKWQTAIGILQEAERALGDRDEVWCVFDKDENELPAVMAAMERAAVHVAFSNPCFELWVLLHFEAWGRSLTTADAVRRVRRHMPE